MTTTILLSREHFASLASVGYAASTDDGTLVEDDYEEDN